MTAVLRPRCRGMKRAASPVVIPDVPASDGEEVTVVFINIRLTRYRSLLCQRAMSADSDTATSSQLGSQLFTPSSAAFAALKLGIIRRYIVAYRQAPEARADAGLRRFIQQEIDQLLPFSLFRSVLHQPDGVGQAPARCARLYHPPARKF